MHISCVSCCSPNNWRQKMHANVFISWRQPKRIKPKRRTIWADESRERESGKKIEFVIQVAITSDRLRSVLSFSYIFTRAYICRPPTKVAWRLAWRYFVSFLGSLYRFASNAFSPFLCPPRSPFPTSLQRILFQKKWMWAKRIEKGTLCTFIGAKAICWINWTSDREEASRSTYNYGKYPSINASVSDSTAAVAFLPWIGRYLHWLLYLFISRSRRQIRV